MKHTYISLTLVLALLSAPLHVFAEAYQTVTYQDHQIHMEFKTSPAALKQGEEGEIRIRVVKTQAGKESDEGSPVEDIEQKHMNVQFAYIDGAKKKLQLEHVGDGVYATSYTPEHEGNYSVRFFGSVDGYKFNLKTDCGAQLSLTEDEQAVVDEQSSEEVVEESTEETEEAEATENEEESESEEESTDTESDLAASLLAQTDGSESENQEDGSATTETAEESTASEEENTNEEVEVTEEGFAPYVSAREGLFPCPDSIDEENDAVAQEASDTVDTDEEVHGAAVEQVRSQIAATNQVLNSKTAELEAEISSLEFQRLITLGVAAFAVILSFVSLFLWWREVHM